MPDFDDLSIDRASSSGPEFLPPERSGPPLWPAIAIGIIVVSLAALWYVLSHNRAAPKSGPQTTADLPRPPARNPAEPGEKIDLPPLDQSDGIIRELVGRLSSHPVAAAWLTTNGLIRNMTVVVANIADGETPAKHLRPLRPKGAFVTKQTGGLTFVDPASYARYDGIAGAVDALDARGVARFYATVKPRLDEAYGDLGLPEASFDRTVERAIVTLLKTPILDDNVQLRQSKVMYEFANPSLEGLTKAQRQFLRMGPRNMRIVKAKLRDVARYLGIPDAALPPPDTRP
jgi:Protein of unknown function (DUF3014)